MAPQHLPWLCWAYCPQDMKVSGAPRFSVSLPAPSLTIYTEYIFTLGSVFTSSRLGPYPPSWVYCLRSPHLLSHGTYPESARVTTLNGNIFILFLYLHDSLVRYRIFIQILQVFSHFFSLSYFFGNFKYGNLSVLTHWI